MTKLLSLFALSFVALTGCVVHTYDDDRPAPVYVPVNYAPQVVDASAGVFWDRRLQEDIWYFDAAVDDPDYVTDVVSVWADVWDERAGVLVESFELYPTNDPYIWYAEYYGRSTYLDPFYRNYTVDIVAYDTFDDFDSITVWADTY